MNKFTNKQNFISCGFKGKNFFPHMFVNIDNGYVYNNFDIPGINWRIDIYSIQNEFPKEIFEKNAQHYDLNKHICEDFSILGWVGGIWRPEIKTLYITELQSDLMQNTKKIKEDYSHFKSKIENRFSGWIKMFYNSAMNVALEIGARELCIQSYRDVVLTSYFNDREVITDTKEKNSIFERIYENGPKFYNSKIVGDCQIINIKNNLDKIVRRD